MEEEVMRRAKASMRTSAQLRLEGWTAADIRRALAAREIIRVRHGWLVMASVWEGLFPEEQHRLEIWAAASEMRGDNAVVSHVSAAILWGLPFFGAAPARVHVTIAADTAASTTAAVMRHNTRLPDEDIVIREGIRCTSLERTLVDIARSAPIETAVILLDAGLRRAAGKGHAVDADDERAWREEMERRLSGVRGRRGVRRAEWAVSFADGRAERPGESLSRLQLHRLGFRPEPQVPVRAPGGATYWLDFGLDEVDAFGEFDGEAKYRDAAMRGGRSADDVVVEEKKREDWIRGVTGRRVVRWGMAEATDAGRLGRRLEAFGITPPRPFDVESPVRPGKARSSGSSPVVWCHSCCFLTVGDGQAVR